MCLLVIAWQSHPRFRLVVAANRDEFHERPSAALDHWPEPEGMAGGRDLRAGGTWLAADRRERFGVITNFRDLQRPRPGAPSRGHLLPAYLGQDHGPGEFLAGLEQHASTYSGFSLLLADKQELWYASNRATPYARRLPPGVYGLSNQFLDTPWPKLERVRQRFKQWLADAPGASVDELFAMLGDRTRVTDGKGLPETGFSPQWEETLSSPFVLHPEYGTRCSTVVLLEHSGATLIRERRFDAEGRLNGETELRL